MDMIQRRLMIAAGELHELSSRRLTPANLAAMRHASEAFESALTDALTVVTKLDATPESVYHRVNG